MFKNVLVGRGHELHEEGNVLLLVAVDGAGELGKVQLDLAAQLREHFGHDGFRSIEQLAATREVIEGKRDVLVVMSTGKISCLFCILHILNPGSGKSLIYQLAALVRNQLAIIVGPLISLAMDQVERLKRMGIDARLISYEVTSCNFKNCQ